MPATRLRVGRACESRVHEGRMCGNRVRYRRVRESRVRESLACASPVRAGRVRESRVRESRAIPSERLRVVAACKPIAHSSAPRARLHC